MVSWQTVVRIAFDLADEDGAEFEGIEDGGEFLSQLSTYWQRNKTDLKRMTEQQARRDLSGVITA